MYWALFFAGENRNRQGYRFVATVEIYLRRHQRRKGGGMYIWSENTTMAGREVTQETLDRHESPETCPDWDDIDEAMARHWATPAGNPGYNLYRARAARAVLGG